MARKKIKLTRAESLSMKQYCASANLRRAARVVTAHYDEALARTGITATQLPLLAAINAEPDLSITQLASILDLERSTVSRELLHLERRGLVKATDGNDARAYALALTAKGHTTLVAAFREWQSAHRELLAAYGEGAFDDVLERVRQLRRTATKLRGA